MFIFTLCFATGVWLLQQQAELPPFQFAWLLAGLLFALAMSADRLRWMRLLLITAFALGAGFYWAAWQGEHRLATSLPYAWQGRDIDVIGVVAGLPKVSERGLRFSFTVEKTLTPNLRVPEHIYLSTYSDAKNPPPAVHAGERWRFTVRLKQPHGSSNPHGYDFELWALENNLRAVGYVDNKGDNLRLDRSAGGLIYRVESWREAIRDRFNATLGDAPYKGVLTALAIGDQGSISEAQWQVYRRTGIVHLMSISGLHITMLSGIGYALINWLWRRSARLTLWLPARKAGALAALIVAIGYAMLAGFGAPAQRTVYMVGAVAAALWTNRNLALTQILGIALLGVLIPDPYAVLSAGFWLSFGAVALILFITAHRIGEIGTMQHPVGRMAISPSAFFRFLRGYAAVQWAVTLGLIPLLLALFGQLSLISPIANAFAIPLISLIVVPLTLIGALLPLGMPLWLAHAVLEWTMVPLQNLSKLPLWTQHAPVSWSIAAGMLGAVWMLAPRGYPARYLGSLMMLPMFLNSPEPPGSGNLRLIVFDVGQGLSVAAMTQHHTLLYDTGPDFADESDSGNRILIPALRGMGIDALDGIILSHDDLDHIGGTSSILQAMPVGWLLSPQPIGGLAQNTSRCRDGMKWNWDGVQFEVLHPAKDSRNARPHDNNQSCVLRISTGGEHVLLTGDIGKAAEQRLLSLHAGELSANLLVVPHHGSSGSSGVDFIAATLPDYAVFTSGYLNRFGHPRQEIMQRYSDSGATLLRSDEDGAIRVEMNAHGLSIERYRKTHRRYWTARGQPD